MEKLAVSPDLHPEAYQAAQATYAASLKAAGSPWLITDFVTMGSPLAHAPFLLTRKPEEFQTKKTERELPTCPPTLEMVKKNSRFCYPLGKTWVPNDSAVFAPTRWTNLYFPCTWTLKGDVVGGPLQPVFGPGIRDVPVSTDINGGILNHTHYWEFPASGGVPVHIAALRDAIRI